MPVYFDRIPGYMPTMEEFLEDLGISSEDEIRDTLLGRCRELYSQAKASGNIATFENSPYEFILCDSTDFYQTLVNTGYGNNSSLIIKDNLSPEVHFLLFRDLAPEQFYPIIAAHESTEYDESLSGEDRGTAHWIASQAEIETAERLGLRDEWLEFVEETSPGKYLELRRFGLV